MSHPAASLRANHVGLRFNMVPTYCDCEKINPEKITSGGMQCPSFPKSSPRAMDQTSHPASQRFRIQIRHGTFCENIFLYSEKRTNEFPNFSGTVYLLSSPGAMDVSPCGKLSDFGEKIDPKRTRGGMHYCPNFPKPCMCSAKDFTISI